MGDLPGGFEADWTQDFIGSDGEPYITEGFDLDQIDAIPDSAARAAALSYWQDVQESIEEAREYEALCEDAIRAGDLDVALTHLEAAAACERRWGDDPTYSVLLGRLRAMIDVDED